MNRVLNFAVVAASALIMVNAKADAAVIDISEGSTSGYTMTDGNTYVIQNSVTFSNVTAGCSGISVESNATVVIYVPKGVTLTAIGANGKERTGGGAGICVPSNATLIVTGEGIVVAIGGNAGNGGKGVYGTAGDNGSTWVQGGKGGAGGTGGGGAGAAIGGMGGVGGISGNGAAKYFCALNSVYDEYNGANNGGDGGEGDVSGSMGRVFLIGRILVQCTGGDEGANGNAGVGSSIVRRLNAANPWHNYYHHLGGGGGGGGGGAGATPECAIGAGGQSGGGGGGGGSGAVVTGEYGLEVYGECGFGGQSKAAVGESCEAKSEYGGKGGAGGAAGAEGGAGELYVSSTAVVDVERDMLSAETHPAAQYTIIFDANGGTLSSEVDCATATLGCSLPDCLPSPIRQRYLISGWKDDNGIQYYDGDGTKMLSSYSVPSGIVLHAEWVVNPAAVVVFAPDNGTTFEESLTISMSSMVDDATIYYTLDGSDPTIDSQIYKKKFRINGKTTIKAIAVSEGWTNREVVVSSYALGQCPDPVIVSSSGDVFTHGQVRVSINWDCEDGVLRYTTDGSDVTAASPEYAGAITIDGTTTIKARAFGETYFDSKQVERTVTRKLATVNTPLIVASTTFTGTKNKVKISCATDQSVIYYTTDGSEPTVGSARYEKPFCVTDSCTVKAMAIRDEFLDSEIATLGIIRQWSIGETMGKPDHLFSTGGDEGFVRTNDTTVALGESMRSGIVKNSQTSILSTVVVGTGVLSFKWKTSCEEDYPHHEWDHAEFVVDGDVVMKLDGITDWQQVAHSIVEGGEHYVEWKYIKDEEEHDGEDCMWVSEYSWESDYVQTQTTDTPVPYSWLMEKCSDVVDEYECYERVAKQLSLNERLTVEHCYVAGVDPESPTNDFTVSINMIDGMPEITWSPDLKESRKYMIWGKATLDDSSSWQYPTNSLHRFFKVTVEMP